MLFSKILNVKKYIYIYILVIHFQKADEGDENSAESETPAYRQRERWRSTIFKEWYRMLWSIIILSIFLNVYPSFRYFWYCLVETLYWSTAMLYYFNTWAYYNTQKNKQLFQVHGTSFTLFNRPYTLHTLTEPFNIKM